MTFIHELKRTGFEDIYTIHYTLTHVFRFRLAHCVQNVLYSDYKFEPQLSDGTTFRAQLPMSDINVYASSGRRLSRSSR